MTICLIVGDDLEEAIDGALEQIGELYDIRNWGEILWKNVI